MPKIVISKEANDALRRSSELPYDESQSRILPDGSIEIAISEETLERVERNRHEGESVSDFITRVTAFYHSKGRFS